MAVMHAAVVERHELNHTELLVVWEHAVVHDN